MKATPRVRAEGRSIRIGRSLYTRKQASEIAWALNRLLVAPLPSERSKEPSGSTDDHHPSTLAKQARARA